MSLACTVEKKLEKKLIKIISEAGFSPKKVKYTSFYELENSLSIGHYKMSGRHKDRSGHISLFPISNKEIEEDFKHRF